MGERRGEDKGGERGGEIEKENKGRWRQERGRELKPSVSQVLQHLCITLMGHPDLLHKIL